MSVRELVVLGTASQVPTRHRNHNGYLLRWDGDAVLVDPGEGTQRQFTLAGVSPAQVTTVLLTHLHGDHCLGLPGMVQRFALDQVPHRIPVRFPASGAEHVARLLDASVYERRAEVEAVPIREEGVIGHLGEGARIVGRRLEHRIETFGYRIEEPDDVRMVPQRLEAAGVAGVDVGRLKLAGQIDVGGRTVTLGEVSEPRRGQVAAVVMDTRWCDAALALAQGADLLVAEATYRDADVDLAREHFHLTAGQAGRLAAEAGARRLVLTHFSQRYPDLDGHLAEARAAFDGEVVLAQDLARIAVPDRR